MLVDVLNALTFWDSSNPWTPHSSIDFQPSTFTTSAQSQITDALIRIYNGSSTARTMLDALVTQSTINIGFQDKLAGGRVPPEQLPGGTAMSDSYILIDPAVIVRSIDNYGKIFTLSLDVILAHEIAHWVNGMDDPSYGR